MTATDLTAWLLSLPALLDGHGHPIARPASFAAVVAQVALEQPDGDARVWASWLDVLGAHESGYRPSARGDGVCRNVTTGEIIRRPLGGCPDGYEPTFLSCGAFQTPCASTPMTGDHLGREQARVAVAVLRSKIASCPNHPLWSYAAGHCAPSTVALRYEVDVHAELAVPLASSTSDAGAH